MMKQILFLLFLLPLFSIAQVKPKAKAGKSKPDGFVINATLSGFADGTNVALLNGQTGASESQTVIKQNKFTLSGKVQFPDFKLIQVQNQQAYITLFLDNSSIKISGKKDSLTLAKISGSPSHKDFDAFNKQIDPYKHIFNESGMYDSAAEVNAKKICEKFARTHTKSFITPLAIIRYNQIVGEENKSEELFNLLPSEVKATPMSSYLAQLIEVDKKNAIGSLLPDFTQNDTAGHPFNLSSLRGKYVLVDFWASWCRPCREENPNVVAAYSSFKDKNFTVLGVSLDKTKDAWVNAINMDGLVWDHVSDLKGWGNTVAIQFNISSIPQNILVDTEGRIIGKNLRGPALIRKLNRVLR